MVARKKSKSEGHSAVEDQKAKAAMPKLDTETSKTVKAKLSRVKLKSKKGFSKIKHVVPKVDPSVCTHRLLVFIHDLFCSPITHTRAHIHTHTRVLCHTHYTHTCSLSASLALSLAHYLLKFWIYCCNSNTSCKDKEVYPCRISITVYLFMIYLLY